VIPLALVDERLTDLAISFWENPDVNLMTGYRRLEDLIRRRTQLDEHGAKLFSQAFVGAKAKLAWPGLDPSEQVGRANLFVGTFMAFRNPRAHRELSHRECDALQEFLLLNLLYKLERESSHNAESSSADDNSHSSASPT
jgi:hypothetical protein